MFTIATIIISSKMYFQPIPLWKLPDSAGPIFYTWWILSLAESRSGSEFFLRRLIFMRWFPVSILSNRVFYELCRAATHHPCVMHMQYKQVKLWSPLLSAIAGRSFWSLPQNVWKPFNGHVAFIGYCSKNSISHKKIYLLHNLLLRQRWMQVWTVNVLGLHGRIQSFPLWIIVKWTNGELLSHG